MNSDPAILGSLLGTAVGDSIGLPTEGLSRKRIAKRYPKRLQHRFLFARGMLSDDTEHTLMVAAALAKHPSDPKAFQKHLARNLKVWLALLPAGVGLATGRAIIKLWFGFPAAKAGVFSAGNGASTRAWDSPLAGHSMSPDGINDFKILTPAVDARTKPTGKIGTFFHPHWHSSDPENFPGVPVPEDIPQHKIKKGQKRAQAKYEIHTPAQRAYGDWAAIAIGGQYYLFCDYDPVGATSKKDMSVAWFTSASIDKQFKLCGNIGSGHPDPDIMFAENKFYLITQNATDYISPGPWVEGVEIRVGVDTDNDKKTDQWTEWSTIKETYDHIEGFVKQVAKTPATLDLSSLPDGYGFQFEIRLTDKTKNDSKPILDTIKLSFDK